MMKLAACQVALDACSSPDIIELIRDQVRCCESIGVSVLCCPEGVLGGLADYSLEPAAIAIHADSGQLNEVLSPLASDTVTTIVGFTESGGSGRLYNSAAVFHRGSVVGVYRKHHPAINRSVYAAGEATPVFTIDSLTFGIVICRDSTFAEPARTLVAKGATTLFVPTSNGMPPSKGGRELVAEARSGDIALAREHGVSVVRADVAGRTSGLMSYGSSGIVDARGIVLGSANQLVADLVVADIATQAR